MGKIFYTGEEKSLIYRDDKSKIMYKDEPYQNKKFNPYIITSDEQYGKAYWSPNWRYYYKKVYDNLTYGGQLFTKWTNDRYWMFPMVLISKSQGDVTWVGCDGTPDKSRGSDYTSNNTITYNGETWYISSAGWAVQSNGGELAPDTGLILISETPFETFQEGCLALLQRALSV